MKESAFVTLFEKSASNALADSLKVERGHNLLYELTLNTSLDVSVSDTKNPKRGISAFQTDICILELSASRFLPRVVIEFKTKLTTHDVITYSAKAGKHKAIYPWLRYGIIASDLECIPNRFFIHNENLDFIVAAARYKRKQLPSFAKWLIQKEVKDSKKLETVWFREKEYNYFCTNVTFQNLKS